MNSDGTPDWGKGWVVPGLRKRTEWTRLTNSREALMAFDRGHTSNPGERVKGDNAHIAHECPACGDVHLPRHDSDESGEEA